MSVADEKRTPGEIPVKVIIFNREFDARHVGIDMKSNINTETERKYKVSFHPALRHHRIEYKHEGEPTPRVSWIHESQVSSWIPLPL
jgi:hypothetical protein